MSIGKITGVTPVSALVISVAWDDNEMTAIDLAPIIAARTALQPLAQADEFAAVTVSQDGWSLEWPCGIDFGAPQLRRWADEQAGRIMAPAAFRAWVENHGFTIDAAAAALGLSRRTIAYYLSGEQPIPKTVMLATIGYDGRRAA
ncbi:DUF2442 domain-containing protein [Sphingorhabdus sp.]|jgi:hypothetical protein|uniref:DUF2442 domain-containing protein n=1 Tax=Sphingorhabdus sp. TaxID=1902408 RepID=UPI0037C830A9